MTQPRQDTAADPAATRDGQVSPPAPTEPTELIRICRIGNRYLLFSASDVMLVRRRHNMCAVFAGTSPIAPSQNAFLSLPLELMMEEARLLLALGVAYVVDGLAAHMTALSRDLAVDPGGGGGDGREAYLDALRSRRLLFERAKAEDRRRSQEEFWKRHAAAGVMPQSKSKKKNKAKEMAKKNIKEEKKKKKKTTTDEQHRRGEGDEEDEEEKDGEGGGGDGGEEEEQEQESLFSPFKSHAPPASSSSSAVAAVRPKFALTPTASVPGLMNHPPLSPNPAAAPTAASSLSPSATTLVAGSTSPGSIPAPKSFPLYAHLHSRGYFMTPGLRFGADYSVYPGDPMRFHAHFLASAFGWDEEMDMLQIVGPGRLASAVKKGFVVAGEAPPGPSPPPEDEDTERPGDRVRAFSIEWAGM